MTKLERNENFESFIDSELSCPECNGHLDSLGTLGSLDHYRCSDCGLNSSVEHLECSESELLEW
jgi:tRNA(Ile2) C34 agmatinyltransferase TiaS